MKGIANPKKCPKCKSSNIMGYALVIGYAYINLNNFSIDEQPEDCELYGNVNEFKCFDCGYKWERSGGKKC